jgi:hypothetical protein
MGRSHRATRQLSADQHVVRRGDFHHLLRVGLVPLPGLGRDHTRHPREVAHDEAQGIDNVTVGDGEGVRAEAGIALPGAAGGALQTAVTNTADVAEQHLAHIPGRDLLLHVHERRADARLQSDRRL